LNIVLLWYIIPAMETAFRFQMTPEDKRKVERQRRLEAAAEWAVETIGRGGSRRAVIGQLLETEPQRVQEEGPDEGRLRYLITSGFAVELITGYEREHHDLDLVIMDELDLKRWREVGTDNVTPGQYWADMKFPRSYLERTPRSARLDPSLGRRSPIVEVVHPAIIAVQKSSNAWGRPPREKDTNDVLALARYYRHGESRELARIWSEIISQSLKALPNGEEQRTRERLVQAFR
jgi:hypothetical protein